MKVNAIKALLCFGAFILFVALHTFYRMAGGNSSVVGAWIGNILFLFPAISVPFYIWKKYPFNNNSTVEVKSINSRVLESSLKDPDANSPNTWLHPIGETTTGETLVDSKTNTPSAEKANLSKFQELDNKLNQLEELLRSGILTEFEFEEKSKTVKFDFRSSIAAKKIGAIKEGQIKQVQSALATGILSEGEAHFKIKLIDARFACAYCAHTANTISENCPNCERDASGKLPEGFERFCCERCGFHSYEDFESCQLCLDSAIIPKNEPEVANDHSWKKDFSIVEIVIIFCALVGIALAILMER